MVRSPGEHRLGVLHEPHGQPRGEEERGHDHGEDLGHERQRLVAQLRDGLNEATGVRCGKTGTRRH